MSANIKGTGDTDVLLTRAKYSLSPPMIATSVIGLLAIVLALSVSHWAGVLSTDYTLSPKEYRTAKVTRGDLRKEIAALGKIVVANSPTLYSSAEGVVTYQVNAGDIVKKGQVLLSIDSPTLTNQLQQEKSTLERLESDLARQVLSSRKRVLEEKQAGQLAVINFETAKRSFERYKAGYENNTISKSEMEKYKDELLIADLRKEQAPENLKLEEDIAKTEVENSRSQLQRQQWIVDELERRTAELKIESPVDGIVGNIALNQKSAVSQYQALLTVVDLSRYEAEITIPEHYASDVAPAMDVDIKLDGKDYHGRIIAIAPEIVSGQVKLRLDFVGGAPENLRQNQRISANILLEMHKQVLKLPNGNYLDDSEGQYVFVITEDRAQKQAVKLGAISSHYVEIAQGLTLGDEVIISDTSSFKSASSIYLTN